jgi:hypothetical protein
LSAQPRLDLEKHALDPVQLRNPTLALTNLTQSDY